LRMAHNRLSPVPRQQLVEPMSRMRQCRHSIASA
jgi:hypothetical protein